MTKKKRNSGHRKYKESPIGDHYYFGYITTYFL